MSAYNQNPVSKHAITRAMENFLSNSMLTRGAFLLFSWLTVWQMGRVVEYTEHASVWFPAAGFTFSCLLVLGSRALIPIMVGAVLITIWNGNHYQLPLNTNELIWAGFLFGLAHIIPYALGAAIISRLAQRDEVSVPQLIVTFLLVAGISAFLATVLVITSLILTNQMPLADLTKTLLPFWIGDMAGVIVLTPLFSGILIKIFPEPNVKLDVFTHEGLGSKKRLLNKMSLNVILIIMTMLLAYLTESFESSFAIFFLAVTHMWIATTETPVFNIISLAVSSILIVLLVHILELMDFVMVYQFAINVIAANALFGIAIPQLKAHNQALETMVFTDLLTGVSSRHYMEQRADLEIAKSHENNLPLTIVVFDLDDFKFINDQYGHAAGDLALQKVCNAAKEKIKTNDVIARFGGDEFVLLLPGLSSNDAYALVNEIKQKVQAISIESTKLSSSFGIAKLKTGEDYKSLFHRADQALYISKEKGGNHITTA
ncbi:MAG: diguanylate cyclase [Marinicella sp.]|nr:sensor domain-containing diguanylate cyclase [Xanthomonadales bacterium]